MTESYPLEFYLPDLHRTSASFMFYTGIVGTPILLLISFAADSSALATMLGPFFLALIIGTIQRSWSKKPIILILDKHIEIKLAPAASTILVKKSDISDIQITDKHIIVQRKTRKKIKLAIKLVDAKQRSTLKDEFKKLTTELNGVEA